MTAQETLPIIGMTCASCVSRVEKALRMPAGVLKADVNLATEKATVSYIPGQASYRDLVEAVRGAGYDVVEPAPGTGEEGVEAAADAEEAARAAAYRKLKLKVTVGFVLSVIIFAGTMQMEWFTFLPAWMHNGYFLWALASVVQFWVGWQFYTTAWSALKHGTTTMNTLVAMGSSAAYIYSVLGVLFPGFFEHQGLGEPMYFDSAAFIITLILLGRLLEARAKGQTGAAIKALIGLQPKTARVIRAGVECDVPVAQVLVGDLVLVRPGEKVPVDGMRRGGLLAGRRVHAHRRADPRGQAPRRRGDRRHHEHHRLVHVPRHQGRLRDGAGADRAPRRAGAGLQAAHRPARRRHRRLVRAGGDRHRHRHAGRVARVRAVAGAQLRAAQLRRRAGHRVPVRPGPGDADGDHGRHRQGRRERRAHP